MGIKEIIAIVKRYLARDKYKKIGAEIVESDIRYKDDWWYVPIKCSHMKSTTAYYKILANLEQTIDESENENYNIILETYWDEN